ncbi:trypsin-like peptidase domain-containing protein [Desulforhopalus vacuolatus]|uniref:S1 family peptidase n=1 Tax=Desulforhopalus vacuolatus TaxID=40414 RepID=UPI001965853A|nr:serine protease [Desulforhopalus vacuolatus]MBM9519869.1 trypsin-like peptidase domain-containing protein [Desulforhopalus vacuolatus]
MCGRKLLSSIVVEVSWDGNTGNGTGFYIFKDLIVTCYHVLCSKKHPLKRDYWIRHDRWDKWIRAELLEDCCFSRPRDFATLRAYRDVEGASDIRVTAWDNRPSDFIARGYDSAKKQVYIGANTIEGKVIDRTTFKKYPRLQLRAKQGTIRPGRSGSPMWIPKQEAIVGMIVWVGGGLDAESYEMALAVPIEEVIQESMYLLEKKIELLVPESPPAKTRDIAGKIITTYSGSTLSNCIGSLKNSFKRMASDPATQSLIVNAIGKTGDSRAINAIQQIELPKQKRHPLVDYAIKKAIEQRMDL